MIKRLSAGASATQASATKPDAAASEAATREAHSSRASGVGVATASRSLETLWLVHSLIETIFIAAAKMRLPLYRQKRPEVRSEVGLGILDSRQSM